MGLDSVQPLLFSTMERKVHVLACYLKKFLRDEEAVTSIEYAMIGALIAVVCVGAVNTVGTNVIEIYTVICNTVSQAVSGAPGC